MTIEVVVADCAENLFKQFPALRLPVKSDQKMMDGNPIWVVRDSQGWPLCYVTDAAFADKIVKAMCDA